MKEINFTKKGIEFAFRNFKWKENMYGGKLVAEFKVKGIKENNKNEGFYYNAEYDKRNNAFMINFKYKNKNFRGARLPENIDIDNIIEKAKEEYKIKKEEQQKIIDANFKEDRILGITYHTNYGFSFEENYHNSTRGKKIYDLLKDQELARLIDDKLEKYQTGYDIGDYSYTFFYKISMNDFEKIVNEVAANLKEKRRIKEEAKIAREKARLEEEKRVFEKAKETGEKQVLSEWNEPCNDPNEECNLDHVILYAMPDGTIKKERNHTW